MKHENESNLVFDGANLLSPTVFAFNKNKNLNGNQVLVKHHQPF